MIRPQSGPSPEPAWEVATLFPPQGDWNESDYLALATNRLVELSDGSRLLPGFSVPIREAFEWDGSSAC